MWYPLIVSSWLCVCVLKTRRIGSMDFFGTSNLDVMSMQLQGEGGSLWHRSIDVLLHLEEILS